MSTFKSTLLTNRDATPKVLTDAFLSGGMTTESIGSVNMTGAAAAGTAMKLVSVPSNARITDLSWQADGLGSSTRLDLAVWYPTAIPTGGANFLASGSSGVILASSIFAANLAPADTATGITLITNQSTNYLIALQETPLWNVLGFTADPEISFDLGFTIRVANINSGYVGLKAKYIF